MHRFPATALFATGALAASATAQDIVLTELATVDLTPLATAGDDFIGTNPSGIAWDGTDLFVAGFNNSGVAGDAGLAKITGALSGTPTIAAVFGKLTTPSLRGYSGIDLSGGILSAAYDDGAADPDGITAWDTSGNKLWAQEARGGSGVGSDPGFATVDTGVGWTTFGSGRRALNDFATGAAIYTTADGMVILSPEGTFWRDLDFDPATGDFWAREGNNVITGTRTGGNSVTGITVAFDSAPDADFTNGQNVAYVPMTCNDVVFFNDRQQGSPGQPFFDVVKAMRTDGSPAVIDWGGFTPADGIAYYDFDYDDASRQLVICDFANRSATIFQISDPPTLTADVDTISVGSGGSQILSLHAGPAEGGRPYLVLGSASGTSPGTPIDGLTLPLNVDLYTVFTLQHPNGAVLGNTFNFLDACGEATASINIPANSISLLGLVVDHAYLVFDLSGGSPNASLASNAVNLTLVN